MDLFVVQAANPVGTLLSTAADSLTESVSGALLPAAGVFALIAGILIGVKIFKKVTGART